MRLKKCPFCGSDAAIYLVSATSQLRFIACISEKCGIMTKPFSTPEEYQQQKAVWESRMEAE